MSAFSRVVTETQVEETYQYDNHPEECGSYGGRRHRRGGLRIRLSASYLGNDPAGNDQHDSPCWVARPDGPIRSCPRVSAYHVPRHSGC